jgi:large subunit ribosomal protein L6
VPGGTEVIINEQTVTATGKLGQLTVVVAPEVEVSQSDSQIWFKPRQDTERARTMWGTTRSIVNNMVHGVTHGYSKTLVIIGVGYRAAVQGRSLSLQLGYSHDIDHPIPDGINVQCDNPTTIVISGTDKQLVGQVAADIRAYRPPEPYKGKGIRYDGEIVMRKEGKKK